MKIIRLFRACCVGALFFICSGAYAQSTGPFQTEQDLVNAYNGYIGLIYLNGVIVREDFSPTIPYYYVRCSNGWIYKDSCQSTTDAFTTVQSLLDFFRDKIGTVVLDGRVIRDDFGPTIYYYYDTCQAYYIQPMNHAC